MSETTDGHDEEQPLSERVLDLFVFLPVGLAVTLAEELPRMAEVGRERLGVRVDSARAVGKFAVRAGGKELKKRSAGLRSTGPIRAGTVTGRTSPTSGPTGGATPGGSSSTRLRSIPRPPSSPPTSAPSSTAAPAGGPAPDRAPATAARVTTSSSATAPAEAPSGPAGAHVPDVASLAIPGFDTLSASQVVQRLDGLCRSELVAVRAYETSVRGRRTILSRVDQLLDERS